MGRCHHIMVGILSLGLNAAPALAAAGPSEQIWKVFLPELLVTEPQTAAAFTGAQVATGTASPQQPPRGQSRTVASSASPVLIALPETALATAWEEPAETAPDRMTAVDIYVAAEDFALSANQVQLEIGATLELRPFGEDHTSLSWVHTSLDVLGWTGPHTLRANQPGQAQLIFRHREVALTLNVLVTGQESSFAEDDKERSPVSAQPLAPSLANSPSTTQGNRPVQLRASDATTAEPLADLHLYVLGLGLLGKTSGDGRALFRDLPGPGPFRLLLHDPAGRYPDHGATFGHGSDLDVQLSSQQQLNLWGIEPGAAGSLCVTADAPQGWLNFKTPAPGAGKIIAIDPYGVADSQTKRPHTLCIEGDEPGLHTLQFSSPGGDLSLLAWFQPYTHQHLRLGAAAIPRTPPQGGISWEPFVSNAVSASAFHCFGSLLSEFYPSHIACLPLAHGTHLTPASGPFAEPQAQWSLVPQLWRSDAGMILVELHTSPQRPTTLRPQLWSLSGELSGETPLVSVPCPSCSQAFYLANLTPAEGYAVTLVDPAGKTVALSTVPVYSDHLSRVVFNLP